MSYSVTISEFTLRGWRKGRGGCVRSLGHKHDFCQAQKADNTDDRTNYAVKYATARGYLTYRVKVLSNSFCNHVAEGRGVIVPVWCF